MAQKVQEPLLLDEYFPGVFIENVKHFAAMKAMKPIAAKHMREREKERLVDEGYKSRKPSAKSEFERVTNIGGGGS